MRDSTGKFTKANSIEIKLPKLETIMLYIAIILIILPWILIISKNDIMRKGYSFFETLMFPTTTDSKSDINGGYWK